MNTATHQTSPCAIALFLTVTAVAIAAACVTPVAQAADAAACLHPALSRGQSCAAPAGIDANTFIVQPPASTRWLARGGPANADHPAVAVARLQRVATVDANTFIVQPPVAVSWTVQQPDLLLAGQADAALR